MRERPSKRDKQQHVGGFGRTVRNYPTITYPAGPDRRASDRYAERQCDNGVAPSWCAAISRWLGIGPAPMFLRWPKDWRRGAVLSTARN
jgi:hypothetical protein